MAHEVETMAYAHEVPWHGLGTKVSDDLNSTEFLEEAGLNWKVNLHPLKAQVGDELVDVPGRFALIRGTDHRIMTVTGSSWQPFQNSDALQFMQEYVTAGGGRLETAGALRNGKIVWGLAELNHSFDVRKGDTMKGYLLLTVPHYVGAAITIRTTTVRVVCANTLAAAEGSSTVNYRQNHLTAFDVSAAKIAVGQAHKELEAACERYKTIAGLKISIEDAVKKVLVPVFEPELAAAPEFENIMSPDVMPKRVAEMLSSMANAPGNEAGTGWGVLNGVTHWCDHVAGRDNASRMFRSWVGDYATRKQEVEQKLLALAG